MSAALKQYLLVTGNYWAFTLTDGALRMLVLLHFYQLGYSPLQLASLFLLYELCGVVTNLVGGYLGARVGLNKTMNLGLALQVLALGMLLVPADWLTVVWVMAAQALSGIAKDLNKMSAKSAIKQLVPAGADSMLYRYVAVLTGSKNALKGAGFFLGGLLLTQLGFQGAVAAMTGALALVWLLSLVLLTQELGKSSFKPKFSDLLAKSQAINALSAARLFLFGARDLWFALALPLFLASELGWSQQGIGTFMACWVIGYGIVQTLAPALTGKKSGRMPERSAVIGWAFLLAALPVALALTLTFVLPDQWPTETLLVAGLLLFGAIFAINSSLHSYLIVRYATADGVSLDVGFYYMANAMGRLIGTLLSGYLFQHYGLVACLWGSAVFVLLSASCARWLPKSA
ncbi:organoarsenical effux MFS transporter ArsJ [Rheinheimera sp.]|uniref:organoarsenical effux MFS transporter ArsJ n=1 Tax=Rheinheimera sp. TaxID=1869214 RepID=UPI00307F4024